MKGIIRPPKFLTEKREIHTECKTVEVEVNKHSKPGRTNLPGEIIEEV